jgi:glycosyltransferase involved in cell wall biosynthesis
VTGPGKAGIQERGLFREIRVRILRQGEDKARAGRDRDIGSGAGASAGGKWARALLRRIPVLRRYEYLRERVSALEEHNRALQDREAELTQALTERTRKLQDREAELTQALTERTRKLQDREAELTQVVTRMSQRIARLSEHNRWLSESVLDAAYEPRQGDPQHAPQSRVPGQLVLDLQQSDGNVRGSVTCHHQVSSESKQAEPRVAEPSHRSCARGSNALDDISATGRHPQRSESKLRPQYLPRNKHILMVTSSLARGGTERQILATADGLLRRGYRVETFCFAPPPIDANFVEEFSRLAINCRHAFEAAEPIGHESDGQDVQCLQKFVRLVDHLDVLTIGKALSRAIREFRPEIVHCWSDFANVIGGLVALNLSVPRVVLAQRNMPAFRYVDGPEPYACRDAYRLLARSSNVMMLNNSAAGCHAYAKWLDVPNDKITVCYNGWLPNDTHIRQRSDSEACRRSLSLSGDAQVVGAVMRFAAEKDPILWLETAAAIAAARPETRFLLAGYGALTEEVAREIARLGLAERFVLLGAIKDVGLIYGALDVFLMTSRFEGSPNVLIEAQAAGIPVVAPNVGGAGDTLLDGTTGIVVSSRGPSSLAGAVLQILDDPGWRQRAAMHGPAFVAQRFGHQRMIDETIAAYDRRNELTSADAAALRSYRL